MTERKAKGNGGSRRLVVSHPCQQEKADRMGHGTFAGEQQIPCGNDRKKSKGNSKSRFFPFGALRVRMTICEWKGRDHSGR
jgi:hypothetical protein